MKKKLSRTRLTELFKKEVHDEQDKIDPLGEHDWSSLTIGWAIAKGLSVNAAEKFRLYIRYHTELG